MKQVGDAEKCREVETTSCNLRAVPFEKKLVFWIFKNPKISEKLGFKFFRFLDFLVRIFTFHVKLCNYI